MAPLTPAINVICWCPGTAYSLEWSVGAQALPMPWNGQRVPRHCLFPGMVSDSGTAYSLEWSVAQALPIPWNGQWLKANEVQRGGGDCALAHWIRCTTHMLCKKGSDFDTCRGGQNDIFRRIHLGTCSWKIRVRGLPARHSHPCVRPALPGQFLWPSSSLPQCWH